MKRFYEYHTTHSVAYIKENLPSLIEKFSSENKREFLYRDCGPNDIWIGIQKGDHAGHWFIATLEEDTDGTTIKGRVEYDPDKLTSDSNMNLFSKICLGFLLGLFIVIFFVPFLIFQLIRAIKKEKTKEEYLDLFLTEYLQCVKVQD